VVGNSGNKRRMQPNSIDEIPFLDGLLDAEFVVVNISGEVIV
jgi:hypothetical protein